MNFYSVLRRIESALENIKNEIVIVYLDLDSPESVFYVPIILGILGADSSVTLGDKRQSQNRAFYFVSRKEDVHDESKRLGCRVIITADPSHHILHESKIKVDIQETSPRKIPDDIVYVIKTSGSTGVAKTVHVTNASVVPNIIDMASEWGVTSDDVILLSSPPTFDPHIIDVFVAVHANATLLMLPRSQLTTGHVPLDLVTILHCTPSLLLRLASAPRLRVLAVGGERCRAEARLRLTTHLEAGVRVYHMYGLTEMSVWQTMTRLETAEMVDRMPILVPGKNILSGVDVELDNENQIVIESSNRKCLFWDEGENSLLSNSRLISGDIGEWNKGNLVWKGRNDDVVKVFGRKVSLIEMSEDLSAKLECGVICLQDHDEIHTFVENEDNRLNEVGVYKKLKGTVSSNMMPRKVHLLEKFPENSSGKINRHVLLSKVKQSGENNTIATKNSCTLSKRNLIQLLVDCWESFCVSKPKGQDNFVSCGGDSFSALAFINILRYTLYTLKLYCAINIHFQCSYLDAPFFA